MVINLLMPTRKRRTRTDAFKTILPLTPEQAKVRNEQEVARMARLRRKLRQ